MKYRVHIYLYDLSHGMAKQLSQAFLGVALEGIWHTGVVVYETEYFFGGGIQRSAPGQTVAGKPIQVIDMGTTEIPRREFEQFLAQIGPRFTMETYSLISHNCNNFSDEVCQFLTGRNIPEYITGLPELAFSSPMGQMLRGVIEQFEGTMRGAAIPFVPWKEEEDERIVNTPKMQLNEIKSISVHSTPLLSFDNAGKDPAALLKLVKSRARKQSLCSEEMLETLDNIVPALEHMANIQKNSSKVAEEISCVSLVRNSFPFFAQCFSEWTLKYLFAPIALFRVLVTVPTFATSFLESNDNVKACETLVSRCLDQDSEASLSVRLVCACAISNLLGSHSSSSSKSSLSQLRSLAVSHSLVEGIISCLGPSQHPTLRMMGASLAYNCSLLIMGEEDDEQVQDARIALLSALANRLEQNQEGDNEETCYRILLAIGHLIINEEQAIELFQALQVQLPENTSERCDSLVKDISLLLGE